jgi:CDP-glucose 4,6-dehydratase
MFSGIYEGKAVWISGHTGFKGAWLAQWLLELGATVHGFALSPSTTPALFDQLGWSGRLFHEIGDIRDLVAVEKSIAKSQPDFVFHLAAQPLVRLSYTEPIETYATNVLGTAHVLQSLRQLTKPCFAVFVTTDKCYKNREWSYGYREEDELGGQDPYSSSKAAAEIAISSFRDSFFKAHSVKIASARAGNVIGGGDWALDRIVPDCIRALQCNQAIAVRNPDATRPWQHVLEPLSGYLWLGARLAVSGAAFTSAFNFGPGHEANRTVKDLVSELLKHWPGEWQDKSDPSAVHEAGLLQLCTDKAHAFLGWSPVWTFGEAVAETVTWYRAVMKDERDVTSITTGQIKAFSEEAAARCVPFATQTL